MMDTTTSRRNIVTHVSNDENRPVVLVADDEGAIRDLVSEVLTKAGFHPVVVHDGEAIPELARQHRPAAILLDVMMPRMDGFTVVTRLAGDVATRDIPVVVLTGQMDPVYRTVSYGLGAAAHLTKPFSSRQLLATLREVVKKSAA
jgi:CheY-like chemotaxis protein